MRSCFDATADKGLETGRRIQGARAPAWSEDGRRVFVGLSEWPEKAPEKAKAGEADDQAAVDVWHWKDTVVVPRQKSLLSASRQQSVGAVWHLADGRLVRARQQLRWMTCARSSGTPAWPTPSIAAPTRWTAASVGCRPISTPLISRPAREEGA